MQKFPEPTYRLLVLLFTCWLLPTPSHADQTEPAAPASSIVVHKSPFCLCCKDWIKHLEQNAFAVTSENTLDTAKIKRAMDVPASLQGCHTGVMDGKYVFEGHVPARLIRKFLANPPKNAIGLAVPGMPQGSPGMYRGRDFEPFNVFLILPGGDYKLYEAVTEPEES
ncbi:DUF411 domain-containing protein [uncultured Microbulbifer sp.]|uniref:DUF411 domain-containing protein n=1 Tax=uncultured Microbulbifer sp. TaxID=348147 RepID=UPI0025D99F46|nr:DUF411 domain-containing protein [uncultured Microbulbifer sp.]